MNIALINASPKATGSASKVLLEDLAGLINEDDTVKDFAINKPSIAEHEVGELCKCDAWVFAFPLYVDGIPSHLLSCLCRMEQMSISNRQIYVYAIVNCGFYEGKQCHNALAIMENWCDKTGFIWGMGIGYGGGGALASMGNIPLGRGPKRSLGQAYRILANAILTDTQTENYYTSVSLPEFLYRQAAEYSWKQMIKANGGRYADLNKKI